MPSWVVRALGMAVLHAAATVALAKIAVSRPGESSLMTAVALALLVGAAALWSSIDGWLGRRDAGRTWFIAGLVAGPVAGVLTVAGRSVFVDQTGLSELGPALTGGAAFTALMVLIPAGLGLVVGGRLAGQRGDGADGEPGSAGESGADGPAGQAGTTGTEQAGAVAGSRAAGESGDEPDGGRRATATPRPSPRASRSAGRPRPQPRAPRVGPSR